MTTKVTIEVADTSHNAVRVELATQHFEQTGHPCFRVLAPGESAEFFVWSLQTLRVSEVPAETND